MVSYGIMLDQWILRLFSLLLGHYPSATWPGLYLTLWSSNPSPRQFLLLSLLAICAWGRDALGGWMLLSADGLSEGTRKKKETEMNIWCVPSQPSNRQIFLDEREEPAQGSMVHHSLGHGAEDLLALRVSSPKASSTLCMAQEDQRREQNSLNSTVVPQRSPAQCSN